MMDTNLCFLLEQRDKVVIDGINANKFIVFNIDSRISMLFMKNSVYGLINGNNLIINQRIKNATGGQFRINSTELFKSFFIIVL